MIAGRPSLTSAQIQTRMKRRRIARNAALCLAALFWIPVATLLLLVQLTGARR